MDIIKLNNINFDYDNSNILDNIKLDIQKGKIYCIIGPNGSGKTTLISIIAKFLNQKSGIITLNNKELKYIKVKEFAKEVAIVKQSNQVNYNFTVTDIVLMGRNPYKKTFETENEIDYTIAVEAMKLTDIYNMKDKSVTEISGGELQRVILARAITQNTDILLLDEPISSLDINHQIRFMNIIKKLSRDKGVTIINIIHDLNLALSYSDQAIMLKEGRVFAMGEVEKVITEKNIMDVYGVNASIIKHPIENRRVIIYSNIL